MKTRLPSLFSLLALLILLAAAACSPAAPTTAPSTPAPTSAGEPSQSTQAPQPTQSPTNPAPTSGDLPTVTPGLSPTIELRVVELEWPTSLRLGESDVLRLALIPSEDGYTARAEFARAPHCNRGSPLARPPGYILRAVARLDGPGFEISPGGDQARLFPRAKRSPGAGAWRRAHRARSGSPSACCCAGSRSRKRGRPRESQAFGRALEVQVTSFLGLTRPQAVYSGW